MAVLNKAVLELHLAESDETVLTRAIFRSPNLGHARRMSRFQKRHGDNTRCGTFKWIRSIKAFVAFIAWSKGNARVDPMTSIEVPAHFTGEKNSLAATLSFAIDKQGSTTLWMDQLLAHEDIWGDRVNPGLKRAGPVEIWLNPHVLPAMNIHIFVNGVEVTDSRRLCEIAATIDRQEREKPKKTKTPPVEVPELDQLFEDYTRQVKNCCDIWRLHRSDDVRRVALELVQKLEDAMNKVMAQLGEDDARRFSRNIAQVRKRLPVTS